MLESHAHRASQGRETLGPPGVRSQAALPPDCGLHPNRERGPLRAGAHSPPLLPVLGIYGRSSFLFASRLILCHSRCSINAHGFSYSNPTSGKSTPRAELSDVGLGAPPPYIDCQPVPASPASPLVTHPLHRSLRAPLGAKKPGSGAAPVILQVSSGLSCMWLCPLHSPEAARSRSSGVVCPIRGAKHKTPGPRLLPSACGCPWAPRGLLHPHWPLAGQHLREEV